MENKAAVGFSEGWGAPGPGSLFWDCEAEARLVGPCAGTGVPFGRACAARALIPGSPRASPFKPAHRRTDRTESAITAADHRGGQETDLAWFPVRLQLVVIQPAGRLRLEA